MALGAGVSLGIMDLSRQRSQVVRLLNQSGVPVVAWLLLPKEQGYWFNLGNAVQARARYLEFQEWTKDNDLNWAGVGLDIEPHIHEVHHLFANRWRLPWLYLKRFFAWKKFALARRDYQDLVVRIRADGYVVNGYQIPYLLDERLAGTTFLQRVNGLVDVRTDQDVAMLYTSFFRPHGPAVLWSYSRDVDTLAVGVTGGGVDIEGMRDVPPLNWEEFSRDLRLARAHSPHIHVFSLEGCAHQGFLPRLKDFDWGPAVPPPLADIRKVDRMRKVLRVCLRLRAYPVIALLGLLALVWLVPKMKE